MQAQLGDAFEDRFATSITDQPVMRQSDPCGSCEWWGVWGVWGLWWGWRWAGMLMSTIQACVRRCSCVGGIFAGVGGLVYHECYDENFTREMYRIDTRHAADARCQSTRA